MKQLIALLFLLPAVAWGQQAIGTNYQGAVSFGSLTVNSAFSAPTQNVGTIILTNVDGSFWTNISASNIVSGGQLPLGTVSTGLTAVAGPYLTTNGVARSYSYNASALTNVNNLSPAVSNWVSQLVASENLHFYFSSVTNALGVTGATNCFTMIDLPVAAAATNSIAVSAGVNFLNRITTNTVTRIETGPVGIQTYVFISGAGGVQDVTAHPEIWAWYPDQSMNLLGAAADQLFTEGAVPVIYNSTINLTATNFPDGTHLLLRWYATGANNSPTWNFVIGGNYDSHIEVNTHNSGTFVGTFIGDGAGITNTPTGYVMTFGANGAWVAAASTNVIGARFTQPPGTIANYYLYAPFVPVSGTVTAVSFHHRQSVLDSGGATNNMVAYLIQNTNTYTLLGVLATGTSAGYTNALWNCSKAVTAGDQLAVGFGCTNFGSAPTSDSWISVYIR